MQDHQLEKQITSLGLTAPRVTVSQVDDLVAQLSYHTYVIPGTTTTIAAAIDPTGFVLGLGQAASVSAANFDEVIGRNRAKARAESMAREELWKLEGYRLSRNIAEAAKAGLLTTVETYAMHGESVDEAFVADLAAGTCAAAAVHVHGHGAGTNQHGTAKLTTIPCAAPAELQAGTVAADAGR